MFGGLIWFSWFLHCIYFGIFTNVTALLLLGLRNGFAQKYIYEMCTLDDIFASDLATITAQVIQSPLRAVVFSLRCKVDNAMCRLVSIRCRSWSWDSRGLLNRKHGTQQLIDLSQSKFRVHFFPLRLIRFLICLFLMHNIWWKNVKAMYEYTGRKIQVGTYIIRIPEYKSCISSPYGL